jgi:hypothetical protein
MFNIPDYQGNSNQKDIEISSDCSQNGYYQEFKQVLARMWKKGTLLPPLFTTLYTVGGNVI